MSTESKALVVLREPMKIEGTEYKAVFGPIKPIRHKDVLTGFSIGKIEIEKKAIRENHPQTPNTTFDQVAEYCSRTAAMPKEEDIFNADPVKRTPKKAETGEEIRNRKKLKLSKESGK